MRAAWLWAWADIRERWASLVLLAAIVALAVGAVLALTGGARQADTAFDRWAAATELPDVLINSGPEPTELLSTLASDPRIARVERAHMVVIAPEPMEPGTDGFMIVGTADSMTGGFGRPPLVSGRYPDPSSSVEIVVNERAADTYRLQSGQRVQLQAIGCYDGCPAEPVGEATIVGVVRLPTDLIADPQTTGIAFGSPAFLEGKWRDLVRPATWLGVHARARDDVDALVADLSVRVTDGDVASAWVTLAPLERAGRWQRNALVIAAVILGLAGGLVVAQAFSRHLAGRPNDPSALAAVGVARRERSAAGVMSILPAVIGGIAGGVALTVTLSPLLPLGVIRRADPDVGLHPDVVTVVLGSVAALAILIGVSWLAAVRWAVLGRADVATSTASVAARLATAVGRRPVPETGIRFALARSQGRIRLPVMPTVFVLAGVVAVLVGALVVRWSLDGLVADGDRYGQSHDLFVGLAGDDMRARARELAVDPRVRDVAISRQGAVNLVTGGGTTLQVNATGVESVAGPVPLTVLDGRAPVGQREIALATATMATAGLHTGDRTTVSGPCGEFEVEVVGRVIVPLTGSNYPDDGSVLTLDAFDELCAQDNVAGMDVNASALVRLREHDATVPVRTEWRARGLYVQDRQTPNSVALLGELRAVPVLVGVFVAALGAAAVAHALVQIVRRRRRDVAVLRALGLRPGQAGRIVGWAAITLALIALAVGVPLGLVVGRLVWTAIAGPSNVVVRIDLSVLGIAAVVGGVAAITAAAAIWPAHRVTQHPPANALGSE